MPDLPSASLQELAARGLLGRCDSARRVLADLSSIATYSPDAAYVWRGQDCAAWDPQSGLYRRVARSRKIPDGNGRAVTLTLENALLTDARAAGYVAGDDLADLATLTHFGAATRLLDVTVDPMTALWFAVQDEGRWEDDGVLFGVDAAQLSAAEGGSLKIPNIGSADASPPTCLFVRLPASNERMKMQRGAFLLPPLVYGDHRDLLTLLRPDAEYATVAAMTDLASGEAAGGQPSPLLALVVPAETKPGIKSLLTRSFGFTAYAVYPDLPGFCQANAAAVEFDDRLVLGLSPDYQPYSEPDMCLLYDVSVVAAPGEVLMPSEDVSAWRTRTADDMFYKPSEAVVALGVDADGVVVAAGEASVTTVDGVPAQHVAIHIAEDSPQLRDRFVGFSVPAAYARPCLAFTSRYFSLLRT